MRRLARWTLNTLTVLSLLLCVAALITLSLGDRSYDHVGPHRYVISVIFYEGSIDIIAGRAGAVPGARFDAWGTPHRMLTTYLYFPKGSARAWQGMGMVYRSGRADVRTGSPRPYPTVPAKEVSVRRELIWCLLLLSAASPCARVLTAAWKAASSQNRLRAGVCPACEYDLTGNVSGVCPECGTEIQDPWPNSQTEPVPPRHI